MRNFLLRSASALVVIAIILVLYFWLERWGLRIIITLAPVLGGVELMGILLPQGTARRIQYLFYLCVLTMFLASIQTLLISVSVLSVVIVFYSAMVMLWSHGSVPLERILNTITRSVFGFIYLGVFPAFAFKLLDLEEGSKWFLGLLMIVFFGDIAAYLVGTKWGRHKIVPRISPKKSLEGVLGGVLGSTMAGVIFYFILPDQNLARLLLLSLIVGGIAQYGDYFESLMKRVADTKDSGSIMPGHGGVLDRIDGVLFASPIVFVFVQYF